MRLFKRHTADTSPQLVSAVPISQDVATTNNAESNASDRLEKKSKTDDRLEGILPVKEDIDPPKEPMDSSILIRKGRNIILYHHSNVRVHIVFVCNIRICIASLLSVISSNKIKVNLD